METFIGIVLLALLAGFKLAYMGTTREASCNW